MHALKPEERRQEPRHPVERLAKIQTGNGIPQGHCLVTNFSDGGVRINTYGFNGPDEFMLLFSDAGLGQNGTYRVVWRRGRYVGAKLLSDV
jgi:hypothetical protein